MATIYDVARKAGVSPKTVSRVLNLEPNVREATLDAVHNAMDSLSYRPSTAARLMKSQKNKIIGFLTDRVVTSPESIEIARGVSDAAKEAGYTVLFVSDADASAPFQGPGLNSLVDLNVSGLIYAAHQHRSLKLGKAEQNLPPLVLANCYCEQGEITSVVPDDLQGGVMAGEMMIETGHSQHVTMLNLDEPSEAARLRSRGFRAAFQAANLPSPQIITAIHENAGTWSEHNDLPEILDKVLHQNPRPTALFCANDKMAMVVYGLLAERGLRVPDDISILGFDDFSLISELLRPRLSTVSIAYAEIGKCAFAELLKDIQSPKTNPRSTARSTKVQGAPKHRFSLAKLPRPSS